MTHPATAEGFLAARWLLRNLLSDVVPSVAPTAWRFTLGANGKPLCDVAASGVPADGPAALHINVTHTDGLAAAAVSPDVAVGVDAENTTRVANVDRLIARYFAPEEQAWLGDLDEADRRRRFFDVWTLKEAAIKMDGGTLGSDIANVVVTPGVGPVNLRPSNSETTTYRRWKVDNVVLVLAVNAPGADVVSRPVKP